MMLMPLSMISAVEAWSRALAFVDDFAGVGLISAGQNLHQGRLAGAIFADQAVYQAGLAANRNILQRLHAGEGLRDIEHFQDVFAHGKGKAAQPDPRRSQTSSEHRKDFARAVT